LGRGGEKKNNPVFPKGKKREVTIHLIGKQHRSLMNIRSQRKDLHPGRRKGKKKRNFLLEKRERRTVYANLHRKRKKDPLHKRTPPLPTAECIHRFKSSGKRKSRRRRKGGDVPRKMRRSFNQKCGMSRGGGTTDRREALLPSKASLTFLGKGTEVRREK